MAKSSQKRKPFTGMEGKIIDIKTAKKFISDHQNSATFGATGNIKGGFFGEKVILQILSQPNCVGIRYYHARNEKGEQIIVLVGEDNKANVMFDGAVADFGPLCPPWCD